MGGDQKTGECALLCPFSNKTNWTLRKVHVTEQEAICVHLDEKLGELKRIVTGIETQIATLTAYRKSLIHECVTGQRRIAEADVQRAAAQRGFDNPVPKG